MGWMIAIADVFKNFSRTSWQTTELYDVLLSSI